MLMSSAILCWHELVSCASDMLCHDTHLEASSLLRQTGGALAQRLCLLLHLLLADACVAADVGWPAEMSWVVVMGDDCGAYMLQCGKYIRILHARTILGLLLPWAAP
jgi:hypothetical protein